MSQFWRKNLLRRKHFFRKPRLPNTKPLPLQKSRVKSVTIQEINISQTFHKHFGKLHGLECGHNLNPKEINMKDTEFVVEKIRSQYAEQENTDLDALKALDAKVKRPANVFGYTYGSISAIVMGAGMSLVMTDIGAVLGITKTLIPGIAVGVAGLAMSCTTYPIYKRILNSRKKKYADKIMELSERIMKG
jgi:hypothetical protein